MLADRYDFLKEFVENWDSLVILADSKQHSRGMKYNPFKHKKLWITVESSVPIVIGNKTVIGRVLYHAVEERLYLDVREWVDVSTDNAYGYKPTDKGLLFPKDEWPPVLTMLFKLFEKARKKERK